MVLFKLMVKALLENVEAVYPSDDFDWFVKVKCSTCGEDSGRGWNSINSNSELATKNGRATVNFVRKCRFCLRDGSLTIIRDSVKKLTPEQGGCGGGGGGASTSSSSSSNGEYTELVQFDCRGLEPVDFSPMDGWTVVTSSGTIMDDVDLSENEWVGYDEQGKQPVGVYEFQGKFVRI